MASGIADSKLQQCLFDIDAIIVNNTVTNTSDPSSSAKHAAQKVSGEVLLETFQISVGAVVFLWLLYEWARRRASSAYNSGVYDDDGGDGASTTTTGGSSVPMLPPELAHDELSLHQGVARNAVTLWVVVDTSDPRKPFVRSQFHERTVVVNAEATTYAKMGEASPETPLGRGRELLRKLSGDEDPEDLIARARGGTRARGVALTSPV